MIRFHTGDCLKWAREYAGPLFHALLTDPPYHFTSIVKRFGKPGSAAARPGRDGAFSRVSRGFMGQEWDGGDIAFDPETWAAFLPLLHPGAFGVAFASARGWHRVAVAIEDAGYILHPTIFGWAYSSGLPKATKVKNDPRFDGHRYGLQALKPGLEPILVFQKPYDGRPLSNITETGAGVLNIDGTRIPLQEGESYVINRYNGLRPFGGGGGPYETEEASAGRWPSNFVLLDPGAADALDNQSGTLRSGKPSGVRKAPNGVVYGQYAPGRPITGYGDSGGASRFFFRVMEQLDSADPVAYIKKAGRAEKEAGLDDFPAVNIPQEYGLEITDDPRPGRVRHERVSRPYRNPHPSVKPLALARWLASLLLPPGDFSPRRLFVPFSGVGSECIGADLAGWEEIDGVELSPEYVRVAEARAAYWSQVENR